MKKRFLAALLSAALLIGTCMPVYANSGLENGENQEETPVVADVVDSEEDQEDSDASQTPETPETPAEPVDPVDPENPENPAEPVDSENPADPEAPVDPVDPENPENPAAPEAPAHIETCVEGCNGENCPCSCHAPSLFDRIMAMQTQEEIVLVLMELSPETIAEFTYEQAAAIEAHYDSLSTTDAVSGDTMTPGDETVVGSSEVRYLTYDFTDAAPFMDPVEGGN